MNVIEFITKDIGWTEHLTKEMIGDPMLVTRLRKIEVSQKNIDAINKRDAEGIAISKIAYRGSIDD
jgi:hypothetical protein